MVAADSFDEDLAAHYGAVVVPARPRKPRDQAAVEGAVLLAQRWILARRRDQTFFSLGALNAAIRVLLDELNDRPMKKLGISRRALYEQIDRPALQPLPATRYVLAQWKLCRLNIDYHVVVERHAYNKDDVQDARAIWTAVQQPGVKTVAVKSEEQQAVLALHRMRQQLVKFRTAQINGLRGLLAGYGEVMPRGRAGMQRDMPAVLERLSEQLPAMVVVETLREQWGRVAALDDEVGVIEQRLEEWHRNSPASQRVAAIPGVGLLGETALVAMMGDPAAFRSGRKFAAWLGLVPRHSGTGGRVRMLGILSGGTRICEPVDPWRPNGAHPHEGAAAVAVDTLDPKASRPWDSRYHGLRQQRRAEGGSAFPTLWGTPWDAHSRHSHKHMHIQLFAETIVLTLTERDARSLGTSPHAGRLQDIDLPVQ